MTLLPAAASLFATVLPTLLLVVVRIAAVLFCVGLDCVSPVLDVATLLNVTTSPLPTDTPEQTVTASLLSKLTVAELL